MKKTVILSFVFLIVLCLTTYVDVYMRNEGFSVINLEEKYVLVITGLYLTRIFFCDSDWICSCASTFIL